MALVRVQRVNGTTAFFTGLEFRVRLSCRAAGSRENWSLPHLWLLRPMSLFRKPAKNGELERSAQSEL